MRQAVASLLAEIRLHAQPASLDAIAVSEMVEDVAPQTPLAARKLATQIDLLQWLIAIEALVAAQAVDLRKPKSLGRVATLLHDAIRSAVPPLSEDRATGPDVATVRQAISAAELRNVLANVGLSSLELLLITGMAIHANSSRPRKNTIEDIAVTGSTPGLPARTK